MLLPWLLFLLVCSCTGLPIPVPQVGDFSSHPSLGQVGGEAVSQWPLPRVMSALPEEQVILEEPVQEESTWEQGVNPGSESYPGQLQTSYQAAYFTWPGQLHSHQNYQHSHRGHQHRHRHGPRGGIQFYTQQQQQQQPQNDANTRHQEILLGLESGRAPSRSGEDEDGGEHRVYQRHLGYQTLHGFQGNHNPSQGNQGAWYKNIQQDAKTNVFQHDHQAHFNGHQRYHGYQPNLSNVRGYAQTRQQAPSRWNRWYQRQEPSYNAFLGETSFRYPQTVSTQDPSTTAKAPSGQLDGSSEQEEYDDDLWSRGTSWISSLWPKAQL